MKRILCYGDSNTWGYIPDTYYERYQKNERFPGILQIELGNGFEVIEEGLNSRTLISEDKRPNKEGRNGSLYLIPCLDSHDPLDLVILMLGTNELKRFYDNTPEDIAHLLDDNFVKVILNRKSQFKNTYPKLIIISPPLVNDDAEWARNAYRGATAKSKELGRLYSGIAKENNCHFIDASGLEVGTDGVHLTRESHRILAEKILEKIKEIFN